MLVWYVVDDQGNTATLNGAPAYFATSGIAHRFSLDIRQHHGIDAKVEGPIEAPEDADAALVAENTSTHFEALDDSALSGVTEMPEYTTTGRDYTVPSFKAGPLFKLNFGIGQQPDRVKVDPLGGEGHVDWRWICSTDTEATVPSSLYFTSYRLGT